MPGKVWDETTYPFLNFNDATIEVYELKVISPNTL